MTKTMIHALGGVAVVSVALVVFAPGHAAVIGGWFERTGTKIFGDTCAAAAAACLERKGEELKAVGVKLTDIQGKLEAEAGRANAVLQNHQRLLQHNQVLLADGKRLYQSAPAGQPVSWADVRYPSPDALAEQLQGLFVEGEGLKRLVGEAQSVATELGERRRAIMTQRLEIEASLRILPAKIALVAARDSASEIASVTSSINAVLESARKEHEGGDAFMRSTQQIMERAGRTRPALDTAFSEWLDSTS